MKQNYEMPIIEIFDTNEILTEEIVEPLTTSASVSWWG